MNDQAKMMRERECLRNVKLCTGYLAMQGHTCCKFGKPKCIFAHKLRELSVPDDTPDGQWAKSWNQGEVDFNVWPKNWQSNDAKQRFKRAFHSEATLHPEDIPNWCWGLALHYKMIEDTDIPNDLRTVIPLDYDWPVLQRAYTRGKEHGSAKVVVDEVLSLRMRQRSGLDTGLKADNVDFVTPRRWSHYATPPKTRFFSWDSSKAKPEEEVFPGLASASGLLMLTDGPLDAPTDAPTEVLEDAPEAHRGIKKGNKQPPKDSTSSSCLAPTMPTRPVPLDIPVPNLAPTVPSPEPVNSLALEADEQDEVDGVDFVWLWPNTMS